MWKQIICQEYQEFLFYFETPEFSLLLLININNFVAVQVSQKTHISLLHLIKILLPYQAPNKTPTL